MKGLQDAPGARPGCPVSSGSLREQTDAESYLPGHASPRRRGQGQGPGSRGAPAKPLKLHTQRRIKTPCSAEGRSIDLLPSGRRASTMPLPPLAVTRNPAFITDRTARPLAVAITWAAGGKGSAWASVKQTRPRGPRARGERQGTGRPVGSQPRRRRAASHPASPCVASAEDPATAMIGKRFG